MQAQRKSQLKILLLSNKVPYPAKDGSSIAMKNMIDSLLLNQVDVSLLAVNTVKHYKSPQEIEAHKPVSLELKYFNADTTPSLSGALLNLLSELPYHVSRFKIEGFENMLIQILQENEFDIVQTEGLPMTLYFDTVKKYSSAKLSFRSHNVEYLIWQRLALYEKNPIRKAYLKIQSARLKKFELETVREADALVSITSHDQKIFENQITIRQSVSIPCGLNPADYKNTNPVAEFDVCYLASFDWLPNVQGVLWFLEEVWPLIIQKRPQTTFALGGRKMPSKLEKMAAQKGILLHEHIPEMKDFISKGKIVIIPLQAGSGMRIKIIENMALGKAMVSTTVGAEGIVVESGKNIILADQPEDFARAVTNLLDNDGKRALLEKKALLTVQQHYNNQALGRELIDFYHKLT